ncbi:MAG: hypothetical protein R6X25_10745 [Candidatus Krumholzibacteriia bacterium]
MKTRLALVLLVLVIVVAAPAVRAQGYYILENTLYLEAGGPGGEVSLNFEKRTADRLVLRLGLGGTFFFHPTAYTVPATLSVLLGGRNNQIEIGAGASYFGLPGGWEDDEDDVWLDLTESQLLGVGILGYRFQGDFGMFMRVAFTPVFTDDGVEPWGGAAFGKTF